jgi:hypothetical protein
MLSRFNVSRGYLYSDFYGNVQIVAFLIYVMTSIVVFGWGILGVIQLFPKAIAVLIALLAVIISFSSPYGPIHILANTGLMIAEVFVMLTGVDMFNLVISEVFVLFCFFLLFLHFMMSDKEIIINSGFLWGVILGYNLYVRYTGNDSLLVSNVMVIIGVVISLFVIYGLYDGLKTGYFE